MIHKMLAQKTDFCNIPIKIEEKFNRKLHNKKNHPIEIIKNKVYQYFKTLDHKFDVFDDLNPIVSTVDNFDGLLIPSDHPARSKSDTYYLNENYVLRTHTSAHQNELLSKGFTKFLVTGDVYRKDEVDSKHYPIFHQMEMFIVLDDDSDPVLELKNILSGLVKFLFGFDCEYRFNPDYFPFTDPSLELEVKYGGDWLEVLGCGVVQPEILKRNGVCDKRAIAAGFGLDRLAMIFCQIPDIRILWSEHERFLSQYEKGELVKFIPYSTLETRSRDVSFFIPAQKLIVGEKEIKWIDENDFFELIRESADEIMEEVKLLDAFHNTKKNKYSRTYRMKYTPINPDLKNDSEFTKLVNLEHDKIVDKMKNVLQIEIR